MVIVIAAWTTLSIGQAGGSNAANSGLQPSQEVKGALEKGGYPWYDSRKDEAAPVEPPWTWEPPEWLPSFSAPRLASRPSGSFNIGRFVVFLLFFLALVALIAGLVWAYFQFYHPGSSEPKTKSKVASAVLVGSLPVGLPFDLSDPWNAAKELRARGDLAGAIIALFVHQLMNLDRLRLSRLAPGRTARQLVRAISDAWVRARVEPTMRLFEASYYGHRPPSPESFESAWQLAEEWEARIAAGGFAAS
jgi:hypothetical protein